MLTYMMSGIYQPRSRITHVLEWRHVLSSVLSSFPRRLVWPPFLKPLVHDIPDTAIPLLDVVIQTKSGYFRVVVEHSEHFDRMFGCLEHVEV